MVMFLEGGKHEEEDRLLRPSVNQDIFRLNRFVKLANFSTQSRATLRFGIAQPDLLKFLYCIFFQGKQIRNRHRFAVRRTEQKLGVEFILCKIAFKFEWRKIHNLCPER